MQDGIMGPIYRANRQRHRSDESERVRVHTGFLGSEISAVETCVAGQPRLQRDLRHRYIRQCNHLHRHHAKLHYANRH